MSSGYNYQNPTHLQAKREAFDRSEGYCQLCGLREATQAHHWRGYRVGSYKPASLTTGDELTALCTSCHEIATFIRQNYGTAAMLLEFLRGNAP